MVTGEEEAHRGSLRDSAIGCRENRVGFLPGAVD